MVVKNQYYYLLACETWKILGRAGANRGGGGLYPVVKSYRLDRLSNPIIEDVKAEVDIKTLRKYGEEPNPEDFLRTHPYMRSAGVPTRSASFLCDKEFLDVVVEDLGTDLRVQAVQPKVGKTHTKNTEKMVKVSLKITLSELIEFACRYPQHVFLLSPDAAVKKQQELYEERRKVMEDIANLDV